MKSVTVTPASGCPLNVTVPEIVSGVGSAGGLPPFGPLLTPLHPVSTANPMTTSNDLHVTIRVLSGHKRAKPHRVPDVTNPIRHTKGNRTLSAREAETLAVPFRRGHECRNEELIAMRSI